MAGLLSTPRQKHSSGATLQDLDAGALASNRLDAILKKDSPLMQTSQTKGLQLANQRGLLNSSIAAETGTKAMIDSATPIAQMDAGNTLTQSLENQRGINNFNMEAKRQAFLASENALDRSHGLTMQRNDQTWQSGENQLNRGHDIALQGNDQGWRSGENALNRGHDLSLQRNQFGQDYRMQNNEFNWRTGESALDREQQRWLQENQNQFARDMNQYEWQNRLNLQDDSQAHDKDILGQQQDYESGENQAQRDFLSGENRLDRLFQSAERQDTQDYLTGEREATQDYNSNEAALDRAHSFDFLNAQTKNQLTLQNDSQAWQKAMQDNQNLHAIDMFDKGASHDEAMANLNGAIESGLISQQVGANIQGMLITSLNNIEDDFRNQAFSIMNNPNMDEATKDQFMTDLYGAWQDPETGESVSAGTEGAVRVKGMIDYAIEDAYTLHNAAPQLAHDWGLVAGGN